MRLRVVRLDTLEYIGTVYMKEVSIEKEIANVNIFIN